MTTDQIRFDDGAAYEEYMGKWSRLVGQIFLDWLVAQSGLRWLDIGCGNGAFTEMIVTQCVPESVEGIDPSTAQLVFARSREVLQRVRFVQGNAMALPFSDNSFDIAVMPLVIFFVPDPAQAVAEMRRVVCPGGIVTAYAWDLMGAGFPYEILQSEMRKLGMLLPSPPSPAVSQIEALSNVWGDAGLEEIKTREITVQRVFASFDEFWMIVLKGPSVRPIFDKMNTVDLVFLKSRIQGILKPDDAGRIICGARANAVKGRVPK